jgi:hypothetical protein
MNSNKPGVNMNISQINSAILAGGFTNEQLTSIVDAVKFARSQNAKETKRSVTLGSTVKFTDPRSGRTYTGTVSKIKIKNILVNCPGFGRGGLVNVPASMLSVA